MPGEQRLTKRVFLESLTCDRRAWLLHHGDASSEAPGFGVQFRLQQGLMVGRMARELFGPGHDLSGPSTPQLVEQGRAAIADPVTGTLFEVPLVAGDAIARPDVLIRAGAGWHVIEVKSAKELKDDDVADLAYTIAVARVSGLNVSKASLALINPDWRFGGVAPALLLHDVTAQATEIAATFESLLVPTYEMLSAPEAPEAILKSVCKGCAFLRVACHLNGPADPVFELPGIRAKRVDEWITNGITRITQLADSEKLTAIQAFHRRAVIDGTLVVEPKTLAKLGQMPEPVGYLDFETISLALPPFADMAPYDVIPIQFSVHRPAPDGSMVHHELLLDPVAPNLEEFGDRLIQALSGLASIVVYSSFEKQRLNWLAKRLPLRATEIDGIVARLVDLLPIVQGGVAHPKFRGSLSIKRVLPVFVDDVSYSGLAIGDGDAATGVCGLRALGRIPDAEWALHRKNLLAYCRVDTLAMVRLHDALAALVRS